MRPAQSQLVVPEFSESFDLTMSKSSTAKSPKRAFAPVIPSTMLLLTIGLAGCSTRAPETAAPYARVSSSPVYSSDVAAAASGAVEVEEDGIAVQTPPMLRPHPRPDDPKEPFSPNYGREAPSPEWKTSTSTAANRLDRDPNAPLKRMSMMAE